MTQRACGECGRDISGHHGNAKFCGESCAITRRRQRQAAWLAANREKKNASQRAYRKRNPERRSTWPAELRESIVERNRRWSWDYRRERGCAGLADEPCPFGASGDPRVLEFDHVAGAKSENLSALVQDAASLRRLETEAAKCVIRCRNCHAIVTAQRANSYLHRFHLEGQGAREA